ncbi:methyl-accepting chemotaxis protein [Bacillus infantis]|jgi:methyl-accepting chemotaxis protein|uniref:methyl-accepting chemotaxis protein n=1 Tax=Bacillus infantis TaxID=324767 RepID=UPI00215551C7|nr:methyl-accepting chemotaxis protein [Bacillus infantis]MCR6612990.1 methyl-accepting chemotaxis protein [Bacillus infantis]
MGKKNGIGKKIALYMLNVVIQASISGVLIIGIYSLIFHEKLISVNSLVLLLLIVVGFVLSGFINFASYAKPFNEIQRFVERVSQGDLSKPADVKNLGPLRSISGPLELMRNGLQELISKVKETGGEVSRSSGALEQRVVDTNTSLQDIKSQIVAFQQTVFKQLQSTNEVAVTMDEMSVGVSNTAETSSLVNQASAKTANLATSGKEQVLDAAEKMNGIDHSFNSLEEAINSFLDGSKKIAVIIKEISDIAGQTNLLALNASIEAARAGEHGKGFAVVAQEVGNLASQTNQSAANISSIIQQIEADADATAAAMKKTNEDVTSGKLSIEEVVKSFEHILDSVDDVNGRIQEISAVSEQMAAGSEEVAASVEDLSTQFQMVNDRLLDVVTNVDGQTADMETVKEESKGLNKVAINLDELLKKFIVS